MKKSAAFSLIEVLVVLVIFSIIGIIVAQSLLTTLRGAKRSDSESRVRSNIDYAVAIMERHLHNARSATCPNPETVNFEDQRQVATSFFREPTGQYIASNSATQRLTSTDVTVTGVTFTCTPATGNVPASVSISINAFDNTAQGIERASVTVTTRVMLRTSL